MFIVPESPSRYVKVRILFTSTWRKKTRPELELKNTVQSQDLDIPNYDKLVREVETFLKRNKQSCQ